MLILSIGANAGYYTPHIPGVHRLSGVQTCYWWTDAGSPDPCILEEIPTEGTVWCAMADTPPRMQIL